MLWKRRKINFLVQSTNKGQEFSWKICYQSTVRPPLLFFTESYCCNFVVLFAIDQHLTRVNMPLKIPFLPNTFDLPCSTCSAIWAVSSRNLEARMAFWLTRMIGNFCNGKRVPRSIRSRSFSWKLGSEFWSKESLGPFETWRSPGDAPVVWIPENYIRPWCQSLKIALDPIWLTNLSALLIIWSNITSALAMMDHHWRS